jgi:hypothetical protein
VFEQLYAEAFPAQLAGLMAAFVGLIVVSLLSKKQAALS